MSDISDVGTFRQLEQTNREDIFSQVLGDVGTVIPDSFLGKFKSNKFKRSQYKFLSPFELFVNNIKNNPDMLKRLEVTDEELSFILRTASRFSYIQYKNFSGMLFALRYYTIINGSTSRTRLELLLAFARENHVLPFDIVRYYKMMVQLNILPDINPFTKISLNA
jgi:hypothetical protein